jgi:hypothetical protein
MHTFFFFEGEDHAHPQPSDIVSLVGYHLCINTISEINYLIFFGKCCLEYLSFIYKQRINMLKQHRCYTSGSLSRNNEYGHWPLCFCVCLGEWVHFSLCFKLFRIHYLIFECSASYDNLTCALCTDICSGFSTQNSMDLCFSHMWTWVVWLVIMFKGLFKGWVVIPDMIVLVVCLSG